MQVKHHIFIESKEEGNVIAHGVKKLMVTYLSQKEQSP